MGETFVYLSDQGLLLCVDCGRCLRPGRSVWLRHLRQPPHCLRGPQLQSRVELFESYRLRAPEHVDLPTGDGTVPAPSIKGLRIHDGFQCLTCSAGLTRDLKAIQRHVSKAHQQRAALHRTTPLWRACKLQTVFAENRFIRYFVVVEPTAAPSHAAEDGLSATEASFFQHVHADLERAGEDAQKAANIVHGFDRHPSAVIPWLRRTGIADHTRGLGKDEIRASFAVPKNAETEPELFAMLEAVDAMLLEAHRWCFDGPECMLTWPRQLALNRFHTAATGKARGFNPHKAPSSLTTYLGYWKQFVSYYCRVVYQKGHFTPSDGDRTTPEDSIQPTAAQQTAWEEAFRSAGHDERTTLQENMVTWSLSMICHEFGAHRYHSALLSFCAMLSVKPSTLTWKEPGNYNSCLSGLIWVVQLIIFYACARREKSSQRDTLSSIEEHCEKFLKQDTETPMGEILGWRLLLFRVSKEMVGSHQAVWDPEEKTITYGDVDLHMDQIPQLLLSEFTKARRLLYDELLFQAPGLPRMRGGALKDNLDADAVGSSFLQHWGNAELLQPLARSLIGVIQRSKRLRDSFLTTAEDGSTGWREPAILQYEATAEEWLKPMAVLCHMAAGQPLREKELFSVTWCNTQRRRNILLKHGLVMFHTTYHKGQQQTGEYKDNIRFLPAAIGDLLLDYLVYVLPLRQVFLRQRAPHATISPYLWSTDGQVWTDNKLTRCMEQACARAEIPRLHISNWRQMTVNIVKTKFAADLGCFDVGDADGDAEEIDVDIRTMTQQRNHTTRTVNRAYANQQNANFGNVWDGLIRKNLRASTLWKDLWGFDSLLTGPRKRHPGEGGPSVEPRMLKRIAMGAYRPRKPVSARALLQGARRLYRNDALQWKSPDQERALVTIMSWTEQVVIILPTGAGKSLCFMLPCTLPDAGVTILVVPLVSLRGDLRRRCREMGIRHLVWRPGETGEAPLVLVSVEAASTPTFVAYALKLAASQVLDRVVVEECHFTVTASSYRDSMVDLASIRKVRTQFVYLTATLPPALHADFDGQNHLVHPKVIRASANRPNLSYVVVRVPGPGSLLAKGAQVARRYWDESGLVNHARDKIIVYTRTIDDVNAVATILGCPAYTSEAGGAEEKEALLDRWLRDSRQPYIAATSALGAGFDHPSVRVVIHINDPGSMVDFAQESGRAGRDGEPAHSCVVLAPAWRAEVDLSPSSAQGAMQEYLRAEGCLRGRLSRYMDTVETQRPRCFQDDALCGVCQQRGALAGPTDEVEEVSPGEAPPAPPASTGAAIIQRKAREAHFELSRYQEDLLAVQGTCLLCRASGEAWDHSFSTCARRHEFFQVKSAVVQSCPGPWIAPFAACYWCYNPQSVCHRADRSNGTPHCRYPDLVMPLCYGIYRGSNSSEWLYEQFGKHFSDAAGFLRWTGQPTQFGGGKAIWGVRVAAAALVQFELY
jgi:Orsellinic acid/F9775 biosynthesis cluster protein D/Helicase conserved C-terminal domain